MQTLSQESNFIAISDLGQAVYLFTIGHELIRTTLQGPTRLGFFFKRQPDTDVLLAKYLNGTGLASAKQLFENYRALRALAFAKTGNLR